MRDPGRKRTFRCAIYTRKSSEEGLEQDFNSLQAQREACEAFIASQQHEGVPIGLFAGIHRASSIDAPEIAAMLRIMVAFAQIPHAVVDDALGARNAKLLGNDKAMHHARGIMDLAFIAGAPRRRR